MKGRLKVHIRQTGKEDLDAILAVQEKAFGQEEEARLTADLLADPTAEPLLSLLALDEGEPVGHVLFTRVRISDNDGISASILAPLAIVPEAQGQGIGGALIRDGLEKLRNAGTGLVFVLGHPGYYPRFGFRPAGVQGLQAPYPIPPEHAEAWMVQELKAGLLGTVTGTVCCAETMDKEEYWVE